MSAPRPQIAKLPNGVCLGYRSQPAKPIPNRPTILMIHSFLTDSSLFAPQFSDPLLQHYNLLAVDIHGHGLTTGRDTFTFADTAADIASLLALLKIRKTTVLGTSQGGFVTIHLASQHPELVSHIILAGSTVLPETESSRGSIMFLAQNFPYDDEKLKQITDATFGPQVPGAEKWQEVWRRRYGGTRANEERLQKILAQLVEREELRPLLERTRCRVTHLHGMNDAVYTIAEHAEPTREFLEEKCLLRESLFIEGGYHYLSAGAADLVDEKMAEVIFETTESDVVSRAGSPRPSISTTYSYDGAVRSLRRLMHKLRHIRHRTSSAQPTVVRMKA